MIEPDPLLSWTLQLASRKLYAWKDILVGFMKLMDKLGTKFQNLV